MKDNSVHYEAVSARLYYGRHATGKVLLRNGSVVHHGTVKEVNELYKKYVTEKMRGYTNV